MPVNEGLRDGIEGKATCATLQVAPKRLLLSDNGIIAARCLLLDAARANQTRGAVPGLDPASHRCRAALVVVPQERLADKKLVSQTRKVGALRFRRVSADGQKRIEMLRRRPSKLVVDVEWLQV